MAQQNLERIEKAYIQHAAALCNSGELDRSELLLQLVLKQNFENLGALAQLAEVATARQNWDEAVQRWERVLSVSQAAGVSPPKKALARLEEARMAQKGAYGKFMHYIRKFNHFSKQKGE